MRAVVLVFLVACLQRGEPLGSDPSQGSCRGGRGCDAPEVCARNSECLPADQVRAVHVMWTVSGRPASPTSCSAAPDLQIMLNSFDGPGGVSWAPVPCEIGKFSIDRLPISFDRVWLGRESGAGRQQGTLDPATGEATLDLPFGSP
jgi:hypothetical protein